jgi:hypothetical protein
MLKRFLFDGKMQQMKLSVFPEAKENGSIF